MTCMDLGSLREHQTDGSVLGRQPEVISSRLEKTCSAIARGSHRSKFIDGCARTFDQTENGSYFEAPGHGFEGSSALSRPEIIQTVRSMVPADSTMDNPGCRHRFQVGRSDSPRASINPFIYILAKKTAAKFISAD